VALSGYAREEAECTAALEDVAGVTGVVEGANRIEIK
jgi:hypothetical protein